MYERRAPDFYHEPPTGAAEAGCHRKSRYPSEKYLTGGGSPKKEWQAADDTELEAAQSEIPDASLLIQKSVPHPRNPSARRLVHVDRSQERICHIPIHTSSRTYLGFEWVGVRGNLFR